MYAGRVACCPLVSHVELCAASSTNVRKTWGRRTDDRQAVTLHLSLDAASVTKVCISVAVVSANTVVECSHRTLRTTVT